MDAFRFQYGPSVIAGAGSSRRVGEFLDGETILLVTDVVIRGFGLVDGCIAALEDGGHRVVVFDAVEADPSRATLEAAVDVGRRASVGAVVGFGGGSPMDVAKLAAYLLGSGDDLDAIWGVGKAMGQALPLVLIPTTAGTGSEATPVSVITLDEGEKRGVSSPALTARYALLDADLTIGLPTHVTAATGIDAMVHAIEAYTSAHLKNPISDMLAREALRLLAGNLLTACHAPHDERARAAMLLGSHLAGVAFANAPVAGVHALAYPLGGHFHVPHGLSNALMLPHVLRFNMRDASHLYAELGPIIDPALQGAGPMEQGEGMILALDGLTEKSGLPHRLRDVGIGSADLDMLAADAMLQERLLRNNPRPIGLDDARQLYEVAL